MDETTKKKRKNYPPSNAKLGKTYKGPITDKDWENFEGALEIQCTLEEVAALFRCSTDQIDRRCKKRYGRSFSEVRKVFAPRGLISLRRVQFRTAIQKEHPGMLIFLGKQYLGQSDKVEQFMAEEKFQYEPSLDPKHLEEPSDEES